MTLAVTDAELELYLDEAGSGALSRDPDVVAESGEIISAEISQRSDAVMDEGKIVLDNSDGRYSDAGQYPIGPADRVLFRVPMAPNETYGGETWGAGLWGGSYEAQWIGRVVDTETSRTAPTSGTIELEVRELIGDILANRQITNSYVDDDVGEIIRDICRRQAPEIDVSNVPNLNVTTDVKYASAGAWDAVLKLAARADAVVIPDGTELYVSPISDLIFRFALEESDYYLPLSVSTSDDVKNVIRVDSGKNRKVEEEQPTVSSTTADFVRVTESSRITYQLRARKAQVHSVDLYVARDGDEELTVRLQSDEGGAPVAIDDRDSDIARAGWGYDNLPDGNWKAFFFADHQLADRDPWLIIETDGSTGHLIGHDSAGNLSFKSYYPHPLNFEVQSKDSIAEFGAREKQIERDNLQTLTATRDAARAELARRAWPSRTVKFEARSYRAHWLEPGDRVTIENPREGVSGEWIISEVTDRWSAESTVLKTEIVAEWRKGVLEPQT